MMETGTANVVRLFTVLFAGSAVTGFRFYSATEFEALSDRIAKMLPSTVSYWALAGLGFVIASETTGEFTRAGAIAFVTAALVILFLIAGTWLINDIFDKETDKHANADRASVRGTVSDTALWIAGGGCLVLAGVLAATIGWFAVAAASAFVFINVVYSVPPLRLKSHALTNMLCNGTLGAIGFLLGTAAVLTWPTVFVAKLFVAVAIAVSINIPYWDLKDAEHDAKSGSDTIVVRFGADTVRRALMVALPLTYFMFAALLSLWEWLLAFVVISAMAVYVLHKRRDDYHQLAYELDMVNGLNHVTLATLYVLA